MDAIGELEKTARRLKAGRGARKSAPALIFVTDPDRVPDPLAVARRLPADAGIVFRGFGRPESVATARALAAFARERGLVLLIGRDARLAACVGAHGVHLPERDIRLAPRLRARFPHWIVTVAAHSPAALRRAERAGVHAALVSPIFPSRSPSAGAPLGPLRLAALVRTVGVPVIALGGVSPTTARRLVGTGVEGLAAVEAFATA